MVFNMFKKTYLILFSSSLLNELIISISDFGLMNILCKYVAVCKFDNKGKENAEPSINIRRLTQNFGIRRTLKVT